MQAKINPKILEQSIISATRAIAQKAIEAAAKKAAEEVRQQVISEGLKYIEQMEIRSHHSPMSGRDNIDLVFILPEPTVEPK